jgi:hypothetical protein
MLCARQMKIFTSCTIKHARKCRKCWVLSERLDCSIADRADDSDNKDSTSAYQSGHSPGHYSLVTVIKLAGLRMSDSKLGFFSYNIISSWVFRPRISGGELIGLGDGYMHDGVLYSIIIFVAFY